MIYDTINCPFVGWTANVPRTHTQGCQSSQAKPIVRFPLGGRINAPLMFTLRKIAFEMFPTACKVTGWSKVDSAFIKSLAPDVQSIGNDSCNVGVGTSWFAVRSKIWLIGPALNVAPEPGNPGNPGIPGTPGVIPAIFSSTEVRLSSLAVRASISLHGASSGVDKGGTGFNLR